VGKTVVDALRRPLFASQQAILTAEQFARQADERGVYVDLAALEVLHQAAILNPAFALLYDRKAIRAANPGIGSTEMRGVLGWTPTDGEELRERLNEGTLVDGTSMPWVPYRTLRGSYAGEPYERHRYLYSPYQLLQLRSVKNILPAIRWVGTTSRKRLLANNWALEHARAAGERIRRLLPTLHAVETPYLPRVMESIRGSPMVAAEDAFLPWESLMRSFDPTELLTWSEWTTDEVLGAAEGLLADGWWDDPLRNWDDLVSLVRPQRWLRLRGDARITIDHKIAAEILLRFYEDLVEREVARPMPPLGITKAPRHSRLARDRSSLQEVLTLYDVSPHPSVVMVLEGATELRVMPEVLDTLSSNWRPYIELLDAGGASKTLDPLMAYAASPRILRKAKEGVLLRPPIRVLVVMDAEGAYVTLADRKRRHDQWIRRILRTLPDAYQTADAEKQLADIVTIVTWNRAGESFEFANWTDTQIAKAILAQPGSPNLPTAQFAASVSRVRARRGNLKALWQSGWTRSPTKPAIARELLPSLIRRIPADRSRQYSQVPAVRVARLALRTARQSPRYMIHILKP